MMLKTAVLEKDFKYGYKNAYRTPIVLYVILRDRISLFSVPCC